MMLRELPYSIFLYQHHKQSIALSFSSLHCQLQPIDMSAENSVNIIIEKVEEKKERFQLTSKSAIQSFRLMLLLPFCNVDLMDS